MKQNKGKMENRKQYERPMAQTILVSADEIMQNIIVTASKEDDAAGAKNNDFEMEEEDDLMQGEWEQ